MYKLISTLCLVISLGNVVAQTGAVPELILQKYNGSIGTPTPVINGDTLGMLNAYGYDGSSFVQGGGMYLGVSDGVSAGDVPTRIWFETGGINRQERMTITNDGNVGIGTSIPESHLHIESGDSIVKLYLTVDTFTISRIGICYIDDNEYIDRDMTNAVTNSPPRRSIDSLESWTIDRHVSSADTGYFKIGYAPKDTGDIEYEYPFTIRYNQNVGINTCTPQKTLDVNGSMCVSSLGGQPMSVVVADSMGTLATIPFTGSMTSPWQSNPTQDTIFAPMAVVGINTPNPVAPLHIEGNASHNIGMIVQGMPTATNHAAQFQGHIFLNGDFNGTGSFNYTSDRKFKQHITPLPDAMHAIMRLKPSTYEFDQQSWQQYNFPEGKQMGFIAQELQTVLPQSVDSTVHPLDNESYLSVNYISLIPLLVKGMQEQQQYIHQQTQIIRQQQAEIDALKRLHSPRSYRVKHE